MKKLFIFILFFLSNFSQLYAPFQTISTPGSYLYGEDVTYAPSIANDAIIQISSSDVIFDLGGRIFTQGNTTAGLDGIRINPNLTNIIIKNGYIQNITGTGIGIGQGCTRITIDNIVTFSCDNRGINISGVISAPIKESIIKNCALLNCCRGTVGDNVLTLSHCVNVHVKDCFLNQNGINQHTLDVAKLVTCTQCELLNLAANDNTASSTLHIINFIDSYQCVTKDCAMNNNFSSQEDAYGIEVDGKFNTLQNNFIQNIYSNATTSSNTVAGISLKSTASGNQILDNTITNSFALVSTSSKVFVYGIQMQNSLNTITSTTQFVTIATVNGIAWSPNGRYLATAGSTGSLRVFEFVDNRLVQTTPTFSHGAAANSVAWSPDGRYVALGAVQSGNVGVRVFGFNGTTLTPVDFFNIGGGTNAVFGISWSPDGRFIALGSNVTPQMRVFEVEGVNAAKTAIATFAHGAQVNSVSWSPDGIFIALGGVVSAAVTTRVINFTLGNAATTLLSSVANFDHGATVNSVLFSPNNRFIAQGGVASGGVTLRALSFNGSLLTASAPANISTGATVNQATWTSDGRFLASAQATGGGAEVRVFTFDGTTLVQQQTFTHGANVNGIDWAIGGIHLGLGGVVSTQEIKVISGLTFAEKNTIKGNYVANIRGGTGDFGFGRGRGISTSSAKNLVIQNNVFGCDINYHYSVNLFKKYLTNSSFTQPSTFANLSFPPL